MAHNQLSEEISPYLTRSVVLSLRKRGITSVGKLICSSPDILRNCSGVSLTQVRAIQRALLCKYGPQPVSRTTLLKQVRDKVCTFPFGCSSIDELLNGGIFSAELTELWGPAASGKTQLCLSVTCGVISATPYTVAYIDGSAGGFSSTHLHQHLRLCGCGGGGAQEEEVMAHMMEKVHICKVFSVFDLLTLLHSIQHHVSNQTNSFYANLQLLVIDPVTLYLAPLLTPHRNQGHKLMLQVIRAMRELAHNHYIAVLYCNNVVTGGGGVKPALGQTWSTVPSTRLSLSSIAPGKGSWKLMSISKSVRQAVGCCTKFGIAATGLIAEH